MTKNTGTRRSTRRRKGTLSSITGSKAAAGSLLLTLAVICFAVGYYLQDQGLYWLTYVGVGLGVVYLLVAYIKNRKKAKEIIADNDAKKAGDTKAQTATKAQEEPAEATPASRLSESQRAQILDRLHTHPELQQLHPRFNDAAKLVVHSRSASLEELVSTLRLSADDAAKVLRQLEILGMVGAEQADGSRSVYVTDEAELSEWLTLVFSD